MELPTVLKNAIESSTAPFSSSSLMKAARELSLRYRESSGDGKRITVTELDSAVYAAVRMPATYGALLTSLKHAFECCRMMPGTVLDAGAGAGTVAWALSELTGGGRITCVEREAEMIKLGKKLMSADESLLRCVSWVHNDAAVMLPDEKYDLVTASYLLGEMTQAQRLKTARMLWERTGRLLLIVAPGTPLSYAQMMKVRSELLSDGAYLAAPCPHAGRCPLKEDDWCSFTCRVARSRLHKLLKGGDAPYEDEKFFYLAFTREPAQQCSARILRHPLTDKNRMTLTLCRGDGTIKTEYLTKKDGELFKAAKKASCGDSFPI